MVLPVCAVTAVAANGLVQQVIVQAQSKSEHLPYFSHFFNLVFGNDSLDMLGDVRPCSLFIVTIGEQNDDDDERMNE